MTDRGTDLWRFVTNDTYMRPGEPPSEAARSGIRFIWERLRGKTPAQEVNIHAELHSVPQALLDQVAPVPSWGDAAHALDAVLGQWLEADPLHAPVQVVVGAPGSGTGQTLRDWAEGHGARQISPPDPEEILSGGQGWLSSLRFEKGGLFVLASLEKCFLRHYAGLGLMRQFLDRLEDLEGRLLLGCNSWAWAYIDSVLGISRSLPLPYMVQALDSAGLELWFRSIVTGCGGRSLVFRQSDNGEVVLSLGGEVNADEQVPERRAEERTEVVDFLKRVASRSRGIPLVAWAIWRNSLLISEDEPLEEEAQKAAAEDHGLTIWVKPWSQLGLPSVPSPISRCEVFILHSLLLHGGAPGDLLKTLLPVCRDALSQGLVRLQLAGLVKQEEAVWRVTLSGYPAVRHYLDSEGYLTDGL